MPRRTDIHSILIIGSGPIVIGQGCEFDYSGVQACRALREEGYRIVLVNSNPATIMTDPQFADATYVEPITPEAVDKILTREAAAGTPVDALLPTLGGQTGLNVGMACFDEGILKKHNVQMIGADREAIYKGEARQVFKDLMGTIGLSVPASGVVHTLEEGRKVMADIGLPLIIRPAFTLGGTGGGIAYNVEEFEEIVTRGLDASPVTEVLIEQSVIGWKEFEMEVIRDRADNAIIICSIENIDPMGVHTGDSITVAPIQTLTDKEYQRMRDASLAVIRAVGVETGGSNIQFAVNPRNGDMVVVEMNPRVSRSSALASKATGYPIAKIAAKLAVGYTLDELPNPITTRKRAAVGRPAQGNAGAASGNATLAGDNASPAAANAFFAGGNKGSVAGNGASVASNASSVASNASSVASNDGSVAGTANSVALPATSGNKPHVVDGTSHHAREDYDLYTSACFEPSIDYVVIKIPRWTFEKFPDADETLTTQMKSVGEAMAIGRTFKEALQKGIRSMEVKRFGFGLDANDQWLKAMQRGTGYPPASGTQVSAADDGQVAHATKTAPTAQGESAEFEWPIPDDKLRRKLAVPSQGRLFYVRYALKMNWSVEKIYELTNIDPWFLTQMKELTDFEQQLVDIEKTEPRFADPACAESEKCAAYSGLIVRAKSLGYSDTQMANIWSDSPEQFKRVREGFVKPVYKLVDTCAAEFEAATPYYYSTYETPFKSPPSASPSLLSTLDSQLSTAYPEDEIRLTDRPKVIIIGGGPNRIGQGIEFDYCCVQAAFAMKELGLESVMINSNPETVSTDYDTSDLLFFEPLTHEDVLNVCERVNGRPFGEAGGWVQGVIVQFGGQTPLNLARELAEAGVPILGTSIDSLDAAGDREQFRELIERLNLKQPENGIARSVPDARQIARRIGYPVLVRPSFVLGGRAMEIVSDEQQLNHYMATAVEAAGENNPILVDKFLDHAVEVDVDCLADYGGESVESGGKKVESGGKKVESKESRVESGEKAGDFGSSSSSSPSSLSTLDSQLSTAPASLLPTLGSQLSTASRSVICGVMEHIEEAGIHSGDSACALPPYSLSAEMIARLKAQTHTLARALQVRGLMNVQYAIRDDEIYVIEVNPRASRTVPFVSKATGISWARLAAKVMAGKSLDELGVIEPPDPRHVSVKEVVFPFSKFQGVDVVLGPEMRSTGEVMGIDKTFPLAFAKSQIAAGSALPLGGTVFISVNDKDKGEIGNVAKILANAGFAIVATGGTYAAIAEKGVLVQRLAKLAQGRPNIRDLIKNKQVQLIINTPTKKGPTTDEGQIRAMTVTHRIPMITTVTAAKAAASAIVELQKSGWSVTPLQVWGGGAVES